MSRSHTFYITTPIYYVNDVPHIGHAYTTIAADVLARYWRLRGREVFFLTGLDEHGQKVQQAAAKAGIDPQIHCDKLAPQFQNLWKRLNISNDAFIRTTDAAHKAVVQRYLQQLYDNGLIYSAEYSGWYCTFDERFWTEKDVVDGLCPDCKRPVERLSERNYFFRMSRYHDQLTDYIRTHPEFIRPDSRRFEVLGFLKTQKLGDLSISRPKSRLSWGIELPFDREYVAYVWFDALVNYVSALEYLAPAGSSGRFWPANVHLVGKDILTTHAVYWSTILMALDLPLPEQIFAHGWWTVNGEKMSKSRGNVVDPYAMVDEFGADAFRYFLLREVPFGFDGDFSREALIRRINSELADDLGNLLSRSLTMIERFANGVIPHADADKSLTEKAGEIVARVHVHIDRLEFGKALEAVWELVQSTNQYIDIEAPWKLAKQSNATEHLSGVLFHLAAVLKTVGVLIFPFMPSKAEEILRQIGLAGQPSGSFPLNAVNWTDLPGRRIAKGSPLFPKIEFTPQGANTVSDSISLSQTSPAPLAPSPSPQASPAPSQITIDEFQKIHLKTAKVLSAERVPKSEKLIKLQVDLGTEQRQIVAGIGKTYEPESLVGKMIVIVANLKPAKLMGIESQGMVLAAGDKEVGGLVTVLEDIEPGTKVK